MKPPFFPELCIHPTERIARVSDLSYPIVITDQKRTPTLVAFCYSWAPDRSLDAFQTGLLEAFSKLGFQVHVLFAQEFAPQNTTYGFRKEISQSKIIGYIRDHSPDLVLSMNLGGLTREIQNGISCPIVTWVVDDFPHLFYPDGLGKLSDLFGDKVQVMISSVELHRVLLREAPALANRTHLLPAATSLSYSAQPIPPKRHNISFVGSALDIRPMRALLSKNMNHRKNFDSVMNAIKRLRADYRLDFPALVQELELMPLISHYGWNAEQFKMFVANLISNNERVEAISRLHDLGVSLYGNRDWVKSLPATTSVLECFQAGDAIRTREQLASVYQSSKISINIPQIQVGSAISYRVYDILASDSLLITKYHPESDAFHFFGKDCPIPMYRDIDHLRELCTFYLGNEEARKEAVRKCNALMARGFSFEDRAADILKITSVAVPAGLPQGSVTELPTGFFRAHLISVAAIKRVLRAGLQLVLNYGTTRAIRSSLIRVLHSVDPK